MARTTTFRLQFLHKRLGHVLELFVLGILLFMLFLVMTYGISMAQGNTATGYNHSLFIQNGNVYTCGGNEHGQLGNGTKSTNSNSVISLVNGLNHITQVSAGLYFSVALNQDGEVYCWGNNRFGQCGLGNKIGRAHV